MFRPHDERGGPRTMLVEYGTYADAQRTVDLLSDSGFAVDNLAIVWDGLRHIEEVTGRRTIGSAFGEGAVTGAWFGAFMGLLLSLFVEIEPNVIVLMATYAVVGAVLVGVWRAALHRMQRGARDFATTGRMEAARYQVWVASDLHAQAVDVLRVRGRPPVDSIG